MYYVDTRRGVWMVLDLEDKSFALGPFNNESDAWFISDLLESGKMKMELGNNGKEDA